MLTELQTQAAEYKAKGSTETLAELYALLDGETLTFTRYFNQTNGTGKVDAQGYNFKGTFNEFAKSNYYQTSDLLEVTKDSGETVYVQLSDLVEA